MCAHVHEACVASAWEVLYGACVASRALSPTAQQSDAQLIVHLSDDSSAESVLTDNASSDNETQDEYSIQAVRLCSVWGRVPIQHSS